MNSYHWRVLARKAILAGNRNEARRYLQRATENRSPNEALKLAKAWVEILQDRAKARACLRAAEMPTLKKAIRLARALHLLDDRKGAEVCLEAAEKMAHERDGWLALSEEWRCLLGDQEAAQRCRNSATQWELERERLKLEKEGRKAASVHDAYALVKVARRFFELFQDGEKVRYWMHEAEEMAQRLAVFFTCAEAWKEFGFNEEARRCLRSGQDNQAETTEDFVECAEHWIRLLGDEQAARNCLQKGESRKEGAGAWILCARAWRRIADGASQVERCLGQAQRRARVLSDRLACVRAWKELTGNGDRARQCLERAVARAAKTTQDWLDCAQAAKEVCGPVSHYLGRAEQAATSFSDWVGCAELQRTICYDIARARRCLQQAEGDAANASDWRRLATSWGALLPTQPSHPTPPEAATAEELARIFVLNQPPTPEELRDQSEVEARVQHCLEQAAIAENFLAPDEGRDSPDLLEALYAFMRPLAPPSRQAAPVDAAQYSRNGVFFYAACFNDWVALYRFQCCDVFICCDCGMELKEFANQIAFGRIPHTRERLRLEAIYPVPQRLVDELAEPCASTEAERRVRRVPPWGRLVLFTCPGRSNPPRLLQLWFFAIDAETLYPNLFTRNRWAPEYICIKQNGAGLGEWSGPLGRQVEANPVQPRYVVMNYGYYNWPWNVVWQTFPDWEPFGPVHVFHRPEIQPSPGEREKCLNLG